MCPCGSGKKYKPCCGGGGSELTAMWLWLLLSTRQSAIEE
jgi:hypothetical protein